MAYDAAYWAIAYLLFQQETGHARPFWDEAPLTAASAKKRSGVGLAGAERPGRMQDGGCVAYSGQWEEQETADLLRFVQQALHEVSRRTRDHGGAPVSKFSQDYSPGPDTGLPVIRVSRTYRVFVGDAELKLRPMARTVLLLFLRHPEGIALKRIGDYRKEMVFYYRQVMRGGEPEMAEQRVARLIDIFNNELNVNIARVNAAMNVLVRGDAQILYHIQGGAGHPKTLPIDRSLVVWEA